MPSAGFIAKEYNLYAYNTGPVSRETIRKWLNGINFPTLDKLIFLRQWLDLDMNELFSDIV
jgi:transcriptional regulator with XRE-family HTH domain